MARIDALSIALQGAEGKDQLAESYGKVVENLQEITLASQLKNTDLSGDPTTGTVEAKRFANAISQKYGTARQGGKGNEIKAKPVVISLDDDTEYMEEVEEKDLRTYGVSGLIERRTKAHQDALAVELDTKFFADAETEGNALTLKADATDYIGSIEEAIQALQTVKNEFVNGVPRNMINVILNPAWYGKLRNSINSIPNSNGLGQLQNYEQGTFNNTRIYSSVFLPADVDFIVMANGAIAQPIMTSISNPAKIPMSDATSFGLFAYKGTKAVTPDLIFYHKTTANA